MAKKFVFVCQADEFDFYNPECRIRFGNVNYHKNLLTPGSWVFGGGDFEFDERNKIVKLSGNSGDFGYPQFERDWTKYYVDEDLKGYRLVYQDPYYNEGKEIDLTPLVEFKDE